MYEELIKRLRAHNGWALNKTLDEATDAIEELSKLADAIPHVCECCVGCELEKKNGGCDNAFVLSPKRAMQYLIKLRWIPVSERLPEEDGDYPTLSKSYVGGKPLTRVLGYSHNLEESVNKYDFKGLNRDGWYSYDGDIGYYEIETVTHWMPLPSTEGLNEA